MLLAFISFRRKCFFLIVIAVAIFCSHLGHAQINPAQIATSAVLCFNNRLIYMGCNEEYRLNESGDLHIPCDATNQFCSGPCLSESRLLLNCIDRMVSGFRFNNQATTQIIRNALEAGCSFSRQRGNFIMGNDLPSTETCNLISSAPSVRFQFAISLITSCFLLLLRHV